MYKRQGLHLCARFAPGVMMRPVPELAVESLAAYYDGSAPEPGLVLGYGGIGTEAIPEGLRLLRSTIR